MLTLATPEVIAPLPFYLQHGSTREFRLHPLTNPDDASTPVQTLAYEYASRSDAAQWASLHWYPCPYMPVDAVVIEVHTMPTTLGTVEMTTWYRDTFGRIGGLIESRTLGPRIVDALDKLAGTVIVIEPNGHTLKYTRA